MTHCSGEAAERQFPGASGAGSDVTFVRDEILIPQIKKIREEKNYDYYLQQLFINIPRFQAQDKRRDSPFTEGGTAREVALGRIASAIKPEGGSPEVCRKLIIGHFAGGSLVKI